MKFLGSYFQHWWALIAYLGLSSQSYCLSETSKSAGSGRWRINWCWEKREKDRRWGCMLWLYYHKSFDAIETKCDVMCWRNTIRIQYYSHQKRGEKRKTKVKYTQKMNMLRGVTAIWSRFVCTLFFSQSRVRPYRLWAVGGSTPICFVPIVPDPLITWCAVSIERRAKREREREKERKSFNKK